MEIDQRLSTKIANMRILCAFLVVSQHVGMLFDEGSFEWFVTEFIRSGIARMAVPFFFILSGFFLARHFGENGWWPRELKKRIRTLLVPMAISYVFGIFWCTPFVVVANYLSGRSWDDAIPLLDGGLPGIGFLWFLRTLFFLVLISPILSNLIRRIGFVWVCCSFVIYWLVYTFVNPMMADNWLHVTVYGFSLEGVAYFSLGIYFSTSKGELKREGLFSFLVAAVFSVALLAVSIMNSFYEGRYDLRHFHYLFTMYVLWRIMPTVQLPRRIADCSFSVYLFHFWMLCPIAIVIKRILLLGGLEQYLIRWILAFVVTIFFAAFLRRFFPKGSRIAFGGR